MPKKLMVALGFVALSALFNALSQEWVYLAFNVFIGGALFKGHEAMRTFVLWTSAIGAIGYAILTAFAFFALPLLLLAGPFAAILALGACILGLIQCVVTVIALRDNEVQNWMYKRSMGDIDDPAAF